MQKNVQKNTPAQDHMQKATQQRVTQQKVTQARNQLDPLLDELITRLEAEGQATHRNHFKRIRHHLRGAHDDWELTHPMIELSSCVAMGFEFSTDAQPLVMRILEKTQALVAELEGTRPTHH